MTPPPDHGRRRLLHSATAAAGLGLLGPATSLAAGGPAGAEAQALRGRKVLRLLFNSTETSFDPARISDLYSRTVTAHIFESLYAYDALARETTVRPLLAADLPEVADGFRQFTIRIRPGVFFTDDPAFGGQPREVVAQDFVYAFQRIVDPANLSPVAADVLELGIAGLQPMVRAAGQPGARFDYDRPIPGLQVLDRHTLRIRLDQPRPRLLHMLADSSLLGAQAREVVQRYGEQIAEHPVGTGPFRLARWRRSNKVWLERNPAYRVRLYEEAAQPAADDAQGQALLARFKGRRLPMVDAVEVAIIEEFQPEWLSFLNAQVDALAGQTGNLPSQFIPVALPGGRLAPDLQRRGVQVNRQLSPETVYSFFNLEHPVVGGYTPEKVALRRAVALAYDAQEEATQIRRGQAVVAQSLVSPGCSGYDPAFTSEMGTCDPARANALLDLYGYTDRNGDGWRETPEGQPLELEIATEPEQIYRAYNELWQKCCQRIGIRVRFKTQQWPENLKAAEAGKLMIWSLGGIASSPDGLGALAGCYGPKVGSGNYARMRLPAFDQLYDQLQRLPDGPERERVFLQAKRLSIAWMPYKARVHRTNTDLLHPWVLGFRRPGFANEWWHLVDIDVAQRDRHFGV